MRGEPLQSAGFPLCFTSCVDKLFLTLLLFLCASGALAAQDTQAAADVKTVVIEGARKTEYRKDPETGNELIFLTGAVSLSVTDGNSKNTITAEEVTFDRAREMVFARGGVTLTREQTASSSSSETLTGETLLFNVSTMEGIFQNSTVVQSNTSGKNAQNNGSAIVSAEVFGRDASGTVAFKDGTLTFCDDPDPHWKIKASRIWLLPGNEFSFLNAVLYVGNIPVFYLPFFYYPKDEMIFNPVFGFRQREGYFIQTTTYFIGRKPLDTNADENSFLSLTSSGDVLKEQRLEGLFLRNLDTDFAVVPKNTLKIMADIYSNLGGMLGVMGEFVPENNPIKKITFATNIGISRNLYNVAGVYVPYDSSGNMQWNTSSLFGLDLPFRYELGFTLDLSVQKLTLALALPLYSDPFFREDFFQRKETMDWLGFLTENPSSTSTTTASSGISSFQWKLNGSYRPDFTRLKPWLTQSEISSFISSVSFSSRNDTTLSPALQTVSPSRRFFFPTAIVPLNTEIQIAGTLVSYPPAAQTAPGKAPETLPLDLPGELRESAETVSAASADAGAAALSSAYIGDFFPPVSIPMAQPASLPGLTYSLQYSLKPKFVSELDYSSLFWNSARDIKWSDFSSTFYTISSVAALNSQLKWRGNFISLNNTLSFSAAYVEHPIISSKYYTEAQKNQTLQNDYAARKLSLNFGTSLAFQPFYLTETFKNVSLTWNSTVKLLQTSFTGTVAAPRWEVLPASWNEAAFDTHSLVLLVSTSLFDITPSFTLTSTLPPLKDSYTGKFTLAYTFASLSLTGGIQRRAIGSDQWDPEPVVLKAGVKFFDNTLTSDHSFTYNLKNGYPSDYTGDLRWKTGGLSLVYNMSYTTPYKLDAVNGWKPESPQRFMPKSLVFKFEPEKKTLFSWKNRISLLPGLSTSIACDMIRPTESYFTFSPSITFRIKDFLDITFSSESRNDVIFRYVQDVVGFTPQVPGEKNIFVDLWNSFAFWDTQKRQESGFKLKSLSLKAEHNLHDWTLSVEFTIKPRLITDTLPYRYDFSPYFSFGVSWKPFKGMKTTIVDEYGKFILNP